MDVQYGMSGQAAQMSFALIAVFAVLALIAAAVGIIAWCMIFRRAGYSWALGLLMLIPVANLIVFLVLAFGRWPIERELEQLRTTRGPQGSYAAPSQPPRQ